MDVMKPDLIWIEGRCYRQRQTVVQSDASSRTEKEVDLCPVNEQLTDDDEGDEECTVEQLQDGRLRITMSVPNTFYSRILGKQAATKKRIEMETKTKINVPNRGNEGDIVIIGPDRRSVVSANVRISSIVRSARRWMAFTHFISLPFNQNSIKHGFQEFKDDVLRQCDGARGLSSSIFQAPSKLHLTIGTLVLLDDRERKKAAEVLRSCLDDVMTVLKGNPLDVRVAGIEYMNDDPAEVDVLYAKVSVVDSSSSLQDLAETIVNKFVDAGLMQREYDRVKLHITVLNTSFRPDLAEKAEETSKQRDRKPRETFDAQQILEKFRDYKFGEARIPYVHLSQRHSADKEGYYKASEKIALLPNNSK